MSTLEPFIRLPPSFDEEFPEGNRAATEAFLNIGMLTGAVRAAVEAIVNAEGVPSLASFNVLSVLDGDPNPLRPSIIADRMLVTRPTITGLLRSLEQRRLVRRVTDADDGRSKPVALTAAGRQRARRLVPAIHDFERELMTVLSQEELITFLELVARLQQRIGELAPDCRLGIS